MTIACALLQQHIQTLVDDNAQWQSLIADDIVWGLRLLPPLLHAGLARRTEMGILQQQWGPDEFGLILETVPSWRNNDARRWTGGCHGSKAGRLQN
jgi:hypothetical protein